MAFFNDLAITPALAMGFGMMIPGFMGKLVTGHFFGDRMGDHAVIVLSFVGFVWVLARFGAFSL